MAHLVIHCQHWAKVQLQQDLPCYKRLIKANNQIQTMEGKSRNFSKRRKVFLKKHASDKVLKSINRCRTTYSICQMRYSAYITSLRSRIKGSLLAIQAFRCRCSILVRIWTCLRLQFICSNRIALKTLKYTTLRSSCSKRTL